ncbi:MAG TPA: DUF3108 domain-containing protein [Thermoanaerobaculia bacterium]|jgi:hypothetical protein|nr:DUF3108 domain-containing protein [Thermoanaerobaculia bacterium]
MKQWFAVVMLLIAGETAGATLPQMYAAGETLDFDLSWTRISGGSARMTIAPIGGDRLRITSIGKSGTFFSRFFKVRDEIESIVDRDDFSTLEYHKVLDERGRRKDELTVVDERRSVALRKGKAIGVPHPVFDPLSLIYYIRSLDLGSGKTHEFTIVADGKIYIVQTRVISRETITTPAGTFNTVVIEPKMESTAGVFRDEQSRLLIWYSDDDRHLPVRIRSELKIGSITATLRGTKTGVDSVEPVTRTGQ